MAAGLPFVGDSRRRDGRSVDDGVTGLLAEAPDDADGLARHLERMARDAKLRSRLGRPAGNQPNNSFAPLTACARGVLAVYGGEKASSPMGARPRQNLSNIGQAKRYNCLCVVRPEP